MNLHAHLFDGFNVVTVASVERHGGQFVTVTHWAVSGRPYRFARDVESPVGQQLMTDPVVSAVLANYPAWRGIHPWEFVRLRNHMPEGEPYQDADLMARVRRVLESARAHQAQNPRPALCEPDALENPRVNARGLEAIRAWLTERHKQGDRLTDANIHAWAREAEDSQGMTIELRAWESVSGHVEQFTIPEEGIDR